MDRLITILGWTTEEMCCLKNNKQFKIGEIYAVYGRFDVLYIVTAQNKDMVTVKLLDTGKTITYPKTVLDHKLPLADVTEQMWEEQKVFDMQDEQH